MPIQTPLTHITTQINGINMHIVQAGNPDSKPLLLLHGFPEFWLSWRNQIDTLVNAGFYLTIPDLRGYNLTEKPTEISAYNLDILADDVLALLDFMGVERGNVIAHDWGGASAWWAANRNPERFNALALLNIPHHAAFRQALKNNPQQKRRSLYMLFFQTRLAGFAIHQFNHALLAKWAFGDSPAFTSEDIQQYKQAWNKSGAIRGMLNWYRALRQSPPQRLDSMRIQPPVTIIWGKQDQVMLPELAQASVELCDNGTLHYIDEASHWVQHEAPEAVNALLIDWFQSH
jgi:pimeloyl-ACP methyl ester carboxylesterase